MTNSSEDGNYLVRVRAQVMSRDDSSGGWVPLGGGGLSNVSVRKRPKPSPSTAPGNEHLLKPNHDYIIYGKRISDQSIVLSCTIKKDFEYNKVMPTFHHWKTGDKKFGLTFQTAADARAFDKGVRTAVEELLDGLTETSPLYQLEKNYKEVGDDDVFMTLNLPHEPKDSCNTGDISTKSCEHLQNIKYINNSKEKLLEPQQTIYEKDEKGENYSYVQLTALHEYIYPIVDEQQKPSSIVVVGSGRHDSTSSLKKCSPEIISSRHFSQQHQQQSQQQQQQQHQQYYQSPLKPVTKSTGTKIQIKCKHCNQYFTEDKNRKGSCKYSPDLIKSTINFITCHTCALCIRYHCLADDEGDFDQQRITCNNCTNKENCSKWWLCLTLHVIFPCLSLYKPLKLCHDYGARCGMCGGRHTM